MFECLFEPVKISLAVFSRSYCCFRFWFFSLKSHPRCGTVGISLPVFSLRAVPFLLFSTGNLFEFSGLHYCLFVKVQVHITMQICRFA